MNAPHEVGQKRPNAFGLYDMIGNELTDQRLGRPVLLLAQSGG
jgi:formylglycine-generating enzyme required for sulfatase activity